ncbi:MAG TPA: alpha/beta fold hydrolase [Phycisphaerales bacterium]|nr:alpha/beta fold hydrolase [Phycisphaerales bacterium]
MTGLSTLAADVRIADADWLGLAMLLAIGFAIAWCAGVLYARTALRNPPRRTYGTAVARNQPGTPGELDSARIGVAARAYSEWRLDRPRGRGALPVWDIPGDNPSGPTVILTHGWGDGRLGGLLRLEPFVPVASRVVLWDLPGHGDAPRDAGPCRLGRDEADDLAALIEKTDGPVVLYGWSLGAGVSIIAGRHPRVIGVATEAPYTLPQIPASRVMGARGLPRLGMLQTALTSIGGRAWQQRGGPFDRAAHAARLSVPLLVLHGEQDPVCPIEDGRAIASAAPQGEIMALPGARHNDLWINPGYRSACSTALAQWLARLPRAERPFPGAAVTACGPTPAHRS